MARQQNQQSASEMQIAWPDEARLRNRFALSAPGLGRGTVSAIRALNAQHGTAPVRGPLGHFADLHLKDPAMLSGVKVGDQMQANCAQAVAIEMTPAR